MLSLQWEIESLARQLEESKRVQAVHKFVKSTLELDDKKKLYKKASRAVLKIRAKKQDNEDVIN